MVAALQQSRFLKPHLSSMFCFETRLPLFCTSFHVSSVGFLKALMEQQGMWLLHCREEGNAWVITTSGNRLIAQQLDGVRVDGWVLPMVRELIGGFCCKSELNNSLTIDVPGSNDCSIISFRAVNKKLTDIASVVGKLFDRSKRRTLVSFHSSAVFECNTACLLCRAYH